MTAPLSVSSRSFSLKSPKNEFPHRKAPFPAHTHHRQPPSVVPSPQTATHPDFRQLPPSRPLINQPRLARPFKRLKDLLPIPALAPLADSDGISLALVDGVARAEGGHTPDLLGVGEGLARRGFGGERCGLGLVRRRWGGRGACGEVSDGGAGGGAGEGQSCEVHRELSLFGVGCEMWMWISD